MTSPRDNQHILVVDDDPKVRLLLRRGFEMEGYRVSEATDRTQALKSLEVGDVDLITLDLGLGADDGLSVARDVRSRYDIPIVMVTGKGDVIDRVVGLELGADDYIAKPFHMRELLARVRSVMRRSDRPRAEPRPCEEQAGPRRFRFDGWLADFAMLDVRNAEGEPVSFTTAELKLLEVFVARPNRVLTRDQLMDLVKGHDWSPYDRTIDNQIARLRKKIEPDPKNPRILKTVRGMGYSFTAQVKPA